MSRPSYTLLDTQVGRQSELLVASRMLSRRLKSIAERPEKVRASINDIKVSHNLFVVSEFKPHIKMGHEYVATRPLGAEVVAISDSTTTTTLRFDLKDCQGDFLNDMVVRLVIKGVSTTGDWPRFRFTNYPGIRLFKEVRFEIDKNIIDYYIQENVLFYDKTYVESDKRQAWDKCMGQSTGISAKVYMADRQADQIIDVLDGAQTLKQNTGDLELFVPLIFWFNLDVRQSLQASLLGGLQRAIEIDLIDLPKMIQAVNADGTIIPLSSAGIHSVNIENITLFTRNLFVDPLIHDIITMRTSFNLVRLRRTQKTQLTKAADKVLLKQLKYPIESLLFGFMPNSNQGLFDNWTDFNKVIVKEIPVPMLIDNAQVQPVLQLVSRTAKYTLCNPIIKTMGIISHGNVLYSSLPAGFYNQYMAYMFPDMAATNNCGVYSIHFNQYYKKFNPSGHYDSSRARELSLSYDANYITPDSPVTMYCEAHVLNFIRYSQGTVNISYLT